MVIASWKVNEWFISLHHRELWLYIFSSYSVSSLQQLEDVSFETVHTSIERVMAPAPMIKTSIPCKASLICRSLWPQLQWQSHISKHFFHQRSKYFFQIWWQSDSKEPFHLRKAFAFFMCTLFFQLHDFQINKSQLFWEPTVTYKDCVDFFSLAINT